MKDKIKDYARGILHTEDYEMLSIIIDRIVYEKPDISDSELHSEVLFVLDDMFEDTKKSRDGMLLIAKSIDRDNKINSILGEY